MIVPDTDDDTDTDGKIGIGYPMHWVFDSKVKIGCYCIGINLVTANFKKVNCRMSQG
jgi:hypothetical protein